MAWVFRVRGRALIIHMLFIAWFYALPNYLSRVLPGLLWFFGLFLWRYTREFLHFLFYFIYKPTLPSSSSTLSPSDITIIIPTVSGDKNYETNLKECIESARNNHPAEIIIVTGTTSTYTTVQKVVAGILQTPQIPNTKIRIECSEIANKRIQLAIGIRLVLTKLVLLLDDRTMLGKQFATSTCHIFEDPTVGAVATRKRVRRLFPSPTNRQYWAWYSKSFDNVRGSEYLERHNVEMRANNAADGGIFVVSGRAALYRTKLFNKELLRRFLNEYISLRIMGWTIFNIGPLVCDDDNFLTRATVSCGYKIKFQDTKEATVEVIIGHNNKFKAQTTRYMHSLYRSNFDSLKKLEQWSNHPVTVWTTFIPSLSNWTLISDLLLLYLFFTSPFYTPSRILCVYLFIFFAKLPKVMRHYLEHPQDFVPFFLSGSYHRYAWRHSLLKAYACCTFWDIGWGSRNLDGDPTTLNRGAFVFDLDGTLMRGESNIGNSKELIQELDERKVPFVFLTNNGGATEEKSAASLSERFGVKIRSGQVVQSHTPFRKFVNIYKKVPILVVGRGETRSLAKQYGFEQVFTPSDIKLLQMGEGDVEGQECIRDEGIWAIFVLRCPDDWASASQAMFDVVMGRIGGRRAGVKIYWSNPDLEWATEHPYPRFGQGSFRKSFEGICGSWSIKLDSWTAGKPTQEAFEYAEQKVWELNDELKEEQAISTNIKTVFMIGDNPDSDVKGCNDYKSPWGAEWVSLLVLGGVYKKGDKLTNRPSHIFESAEEAVSWALKKIS
ncbi:HAD-like domain-containing protein [Xylaria arbuscula]|nr:HAD-like domain-containing protein [Xylaria arbuscula]